MHIQIQAKASNEDKSNKAHIRTHYISFSSHMESEILKADGVPEGH